MKKLLSAVVLAVLFTTFVGATTIPEPTTEKVKVEERANAYIYITKVYASEYWAEFYIVYEEPKDQFDETAAEKALYEFISRYKVEKKFSRVEVEDLESAKEDSANIRVKKRIIFRQNRK